MVGVWGCEGRFGAVDGDHVVWEFKGWGEVEGADARRVGFRGGGWGGGGLREGVGDGDGGGSLGGVDMLAWGWCGGWRG